MPDAPGLVVRPLGPADIERHGDALANLLLDAFAHGAAMDMRAPFGRDDARAYWRSVADRAAAGAVVVWGAFQDARLIGTVQLLLATPPNQAHRAQVAKLMVASAARRRGIARALMVALEARAGVLGRTLLTLETVAGSAAETLWRALGYIHAGTVPGYELRPDGAPADTAIFYKELRR